MRYIFVGKESHRNTIYKDIQGRNIYPEALTNYQQGIQWYEGGKFFIGSKDCLILFASYFKDIETCRKEILRLRSNSPETFMMLIAKKDVEDNFLFTQTMENCNIVTFYTQGIAVEEILSALPKFKIKLRLKCIRKPEKRPKQPHIKDDTVDKVLKWVIKKLDDSKKLSSNPNSSYPITYSQSYCKAN